METYLQTGNFPLRTVSKEEVSTEATHLGQGVYSAPIQYGELN